MTWHKKGNLENCIWFLKVYVRLCNKQCTLNYIGLGLKSNFPSELILRFKYINLNSFCEYKFYSLHHCNTTLAQKLKLEESRSSSGEWKTGNLVFEDSELFLRLYIQHPFKYVERHLCISTDSKATLNGASAPMVHI